MRFDEGREVGVHIGNNGRAHNKLNGDGRGDNRFDLYAGGVDIRWEISIPKRHTAFNYLFGYCLIHGFTIQLFQGKFA